MRPGESSRPCTRNRPKVNHAAPGARSQPADEAARKADKRGGRKAKSAADAQEIRELLNKFEEQKLKGQQESSTPSRPAPRPAGGGKPSKKTRRRRQDAERRAAPPRPTRTIQFKDGEKPEGDPPAHGSVVPQQGPGAAADDAWQGLHHGPVRSGACSAA